MSARRGVGSETRLSNLTSLTLHAYVSSFFTLSLLEESPLLKQLDLDLHPKGYKMSMDFEQEDSVTWEGLRAKTQVILPMVRDVKLTNITRQEGVLKYLKLPRCQQLTLSDPGSTIVPLLPGCLEGSTTTLEQLDPGLLKLLQVFPRIRSLALYRLEPFAGTIFEDLLCYENCGVLPTLQSLEIAGNWKRFDTETLVRYIRAKGRSLRGKDVPEGGGFEYVDGTLNWALFRDWLYPELFVRYDAFDRSVKLLRTVKVDAEDTAIGSTPMIAP